MKSPSGCSLKREALQRQHRLLGNLPSVDEASAVIKPDIPPPRAVIFIDERSNHVRPSWAGSGGKPPVRPDRSLIPGFGLDPGRLNNQARGQDAVGHRAGRRRARGANGGKPAVEPRRDADRHRPRLQRRGRGVGVPLRAAGWAGGLGGRRVVCRVLRVARAGARRAGRAGGRPGWTPRSSLGAGTRCRSSTRR